MSTLWKALIALMLVFGLPTASFAGIIFGNELGNSSAPGGRVYTDINAAVADGGSHGNPFLLGSIAGDPFTMSLAVSSSSGGSLNWSTYEKQFIGNALYRTENGNPYIVGQRDGAESSPGGRVPATLEFHSGTLHETVFPYVPGLSNTGILLGGNPLTSGGQIAGYTSAFPAIYSLDGSRRLDTGSPFSGGAAYDHAGTLTVGEVNGKVSGWNQVGGIDVRMDIKLPSWSDGTGRLEKIVEDRIVGYLYDPNADDIRVVVWNKDGTINRVSDQIGYHVSKAVFAGDTLMLLMNTSLFDKDTLFFADGYATERALYGDLRPYVDTKIATSFTDGGGLWFLDRKEVNGEFFYGVSEVEVTYDVSSVPEPSTGILALLFAITAFIAKAGRWLLKLILPRAAHVLVEVVTNPK